MVMDGVSPSEVKDEMNANAAKREELRAMLAAANTAVAPPPGVSPEFVNPLFLRSCCNALEREGRREFPKGLTGTKAILSSYLDSIGKHLDETRSGSEDLIAPTKRSLAALARRMAAARRNYVPLHEATELATDSFQPYPAPAGLTWLDVLRRNGLLRLDPDPDVKADAPPAATSDVVRFSFQRFQDHLMAEVLLANVPHVKAAFADGGPLAFVRTERRFQWEWRGLIEALSIQIPERTRQELVDVLPGGTKHW